MRRTSSVPREYFEGLYRASADPWSFETSSYEKAKYEATLEALGDSCGNLLEIGCSIGVLTQLLAPRCRHVLALDVVGKALSLARKRCRHETNVEFRNLAVPQELPPGLFDEILLSEVAYYWNEKDLDRFIEWLPSALSAKGRCILVHWAGETDYPLTADEVHNRMIAGVNRVLHLTQSMRKPEYRLDVLSR
jgi:cyclopropane fatty-acyl-phospholipid synthase-like methyltransferase